MLWQLRMKASSIETSSRRNIDLGGLGPSELALPQRCLDAQIREAS
jgi:hypothetical protein